MYEIHHLNSKFKEIKIHNSTAILDSIDETFSSSATPAFVSMLALSICMFMAAFVQVAKVFIFRNFDLVAESS